MQRSILLAVPLLVFAGHAPAARAQAASEPTAQQTVPALGNYLNLATILNLARGTVRIVAIVAPSSPTAREGLEAVASILNDIPSKRLRAYVVLSGASEDDTQVRALDLAARHRDKRIVYVWDAEGAAADAMSPLLGPEQGPAREVYFLYDTDATFTMTPAAPVLWMHLNSEIDGPRLQAATVRERAAALVRAVEQKAAEAAASSSRED